MSETLSPASGRRYGLATVCRVWRLARSGVYRHLRPPAIPPRIPDRWGRCRMRRQLPVLPRHRGRHAERVADV